MIATIRRKSTMTYDKPAIASALDLTGQLEDQYFSRKAKSVG
jgi:hypothetical protein